MEVHQPRRDRQNACSQQQIEQEIALQMVERLAQQALAAKMRNVDRGGQ